MTASAILSAPSVAADARAKSHPVLTYKGIRAEWDLYEDAPGLGALHTVCPRCAQYGLITQGNKQFHIDDRGLLSIDEPFRCDYCHWRFGVKDGQMFDA